ncbi:MAG: hypothetical protein R2712_26350 [Vicinamibacterales bacterium]
MSHLFDLHPGCATVGETANLIFGPWQAVALSSSSIAPLRDGDRWVGEDERAGMVVRQCFLTCFPDDRAHWMQKPVGVPKAVSERFEDVTTAGPRPVLARAAHGVPRARYMAIMRHPCDVVLSGRSKWGFADRSMWRTLSVLAEVPTADSPVQHVVRYERLIADREATVRAMCGGGRRLRCGDAVRVRRDPGAGARPGIRHAGFSRQEEWATLDPGQLTDAQRQAITAAYDRFGGGVEWPAHFDAPATASAAATPVQTEVQRLLQVAQLGSRIERAMFEQAEELKRRDVAWQDRELECAAREEKLTSLWHDQQKVITRYQDERAQLLEQVALWQAAAQVRREGSSLVTQPGRTRTPSPSSGASPPAAPSRCSCAAAPRDARMPMVGWFDPDQLFSTGLKSLLSFVVGERGDRRIVQALASRRQEYYDHAIHYRDGSRGPQPRKDRPREELWLDFIADTGDGWNSTYAVAYAAAQRALRV